MTQTPTRLSPWEYAAQDFETRALADDFGSDSGEGESPHWATPGTLAKRLNPKTVQTPALDLVDAELLELVNTSDGRLIVVMPPQEGKSTRVAHDFIVWVLKHRPLTRVVGASYGQGLANRNGRGIRNTITSNPELGLDVASDNGSASEWQLVSGAGGVGQGGLVSVGIGAGLTGRPADLMVIDDPIKDRKEADSEKYREAVWDWWTDVASTRLAPGAPVVLILTRWHNDDLAGRLLAAEDGHLWKVLRIPAEADHDPAKGETDPLDREPGEFMVSARINEKTGKPRTDEQWRAIRTRVGSRTWSALYQGRPSAVEGTIFRRTLWKEYEHPLWVVHPNGSHIVPSYDDLLMSWDLTFKKTQGSDFVAGQVWMRRGVDAYLLDQVYGRMDFPGTIKAFRQLTAKWPQATLKIVEDKANGPAVIASLRHKIPGIVPEEPQGGKEARAAAVSPLVEAGNVWLPSPELAPWVTGLIEEAAAFPTGAHDDQVDALTQALNRLVLQPLLANALEVYDETDVDDELADYRITPY